MNAIQTYIIRFLENWHLNRIRNHILFWVFNVSVYFFFEYLYGNDMYEAFITKAFTLPILVLSSYFVAYYLAPALFKKKYLKFLLAFSIGSYLFSVWYRYMVVYWIEPITDPLLDKNSIHDILTNMQAVFGQYILLVYITPIFFILLKSAKDSYVVRRRYLKLEKEKKTTELNFLRSQVHPHFLFNTLNNIYVLALKKDKRTNGVVKKLADMMEYMVQSSERPLVPIQKEIDLISNYLDLEKLRYGDRLDLEFVSEVDDQDTRIAPLMLMSFIENAFKHGVSGDLNKPEVKISLNVTQGVLEFNSYNTKNELKQKDDKSYKKGIGVSNVKRQLDIIYHDNYTLNIEEGSNYYKVYLKLNQLAGIKELKPKSA